MVISRRTQWYGYADLLVLAGEYEQARSICEQLIEVVEANIEPHGIDLLVFSRIHIALVYKELKVEPEALQK